MICLKICTLIFLCTSTFNASANASAFFEKYRIEHITNQSGLSNSSVNVITQDSAGRMWFGTWDGLNAYNGHTFITYKPDPNNPNSIINNVIRNIAEENKRFLWLATDRGIDCLDRKTGHFIHFFKELASNENAFDIQVDKQGNVLAKVQGQGVFIFNRKKNIFQPCDAKLFITKNTFSDTLIAQIKNILPSCNILSIFYGTQNIIWTGTDMQGIYMLIPQNLSFIPQKVPQAAVRSFMVSENKLLVGTKGNGILLYRLNGTTLSQTDNYTTADGLVNNSVFSMTKDNEGKIWIGTDGTGLNYYNPQQHKIQTVKSNDKRIASVYALYFSSPDTLYAGTSGNGLIRIVINRETTPYTIRSIQQYSLKSNVVFSIIPENKDILLIGTRGGGLHRLNLRTQNIEIYSFQSSADDMLSLHLDKQRNPKNLWIGTSAGLLQMTLKDNKWQLVNRFSEEDGLPNNTVHGILEDNENNLWISSNKGIAKLINNSRRIISFYQADGLQNNEFSDGAYYCLEGGSENGLENSQMLCFGGIGGFNIFNPATINTSTYMPPIQLEAFYVKNIAEQIGNRIKNGALTLSTNDLPASLRFFSVDYIFGSKCEYAYFLEEISNDWISLGTSSTVVLNRLKPGKYLLKVRNSNAEKVWNSSIFELPVYIPTPWWKSVWAYIVYILIGLIIMLQIRRQIKYHSKMQIEEQIHQAKLRFFTNIAHEFSNSLTLIYAPSEQLKTIVEENPVAQKHLNVIKKNTARMQRLIKQLVEFRKVDSGFLKMEVVPVDITALVNNILELFMDSIQKNNFILETNFSSDCIIWNTDPGGLEKILVNLISNAVKYTPAGEQIIIDIQSAENLVITVTNTGTGIPVSEQETIFDRFKVLEQFEKNISKNIELSSGIGLAMCCTLIEKMDGKMRLQSDGKSYASFVISLVKKDTETNDVTQYSLSSNLIETETDEEINIAADIALPQTLPVLPEEKTLCTILIIDDDTRIQTLLDDILSSRYTIITAANGQDALAMLETTIPDLIISDLIMPVMDGFQFVSILKSKEQYKHIPVIMLSGKDTLESKVGGIEIGADIYISKPFAPTHLIASAERLLKTKNNILQYASSPYADMEKYKQKTISKEDKLFLTNIHKIIKTKLSDEDLSPTVIAQKLNMSRMRFYRKVLALTGKTPIDLIRSTRLEQAERMLQTTSKTVKEIMFACGFNNKAYFHREFAKRHGKTPAVYRKGNMD